MKHTAHTDKLQPFLDRLGAGDPCLLLALGDSNACNATFTAGGKQWPELLHSELRIRYQTQQVLLVNAGVCGATVRDALARWESDVARFRPEMTVVCLGSNDAKRMTDDEFDEGLCEVLDRLAAMGSGVLLRTPTPVMEYEPAPEHLWTGDELLRGKVERIRRIAADRALPFVDTYAHWWELEEAGTLTVGGLMHDAVHTNAKGHQLVYRGLAAAFDLPEKLHWERGAGEP